MADGQTRKVKVTETYTPSESLRTLYPGSEYTLDAEAAKEVVDAKAGHYSNTSSGSNEAKGGKS